MYAMLLTEPRISFGSLKSIAIPVLVMAGEKDIILEKHTRGIAENIPNSLLWIFKDATHYAPVEQPNEFNRVVLSFFSEVVGYK
jgi:pimeloyl-ACP methyl ester carboxylesterase